MPSWNGKLSVPSALLYDHDDVRAGFVRAKLEGGAIALASERVAQLCLPHFEYEEKSVFPVLGLLPYMSPGALRPEMMQVMPLISDFTIKHNALASDHESILAAIVGLLQAAHIRENREIAKFAYKLSVHEWIEDEVIYPTVALIGHYLRDKFES
jgi:hypothetical protein